MNWYLTLSDCSLQHCGQEIKPGQKILLSKEQADLHNAETAQVLKCDPPTEVSEAAIALEFEEWQKNRSAEGFPKPAEESQKVKNKK